MTVIIILSLWQGWKIMKVIDGDRYWKKRGIINMNRNINYIKNNGIISSSYQLKQSLLMNSNNNMLLSSYNNNK